MLKAIIFDMDGVLTDSIEGIWDSFEILLKEYGVNFSKEYIQKMFDPEIITINENIKFTFKPQPKKNNFHKKP